MLFPPHLHIVFALCLSSFAPFRTSDPGSYSRHPLPPRLRCTPSFLHFCEENAPEILSRVDSHRVVHKRRSTRYLHVNGTTSQNSLAGSTSLD